MANFEKKIKLSIHKHNLLHHDARVIVAFSGGADSVALLHSLHSLKYDCIAAHCNFHLRGEESDRDELFATDFAKQLGIKILVKHFDVTEYEKQHGISTEMACRELRYEWFEQMRQEYKAQAIAVAHHRDDNIETMFLNLLRGTGITGIAAMNPINGYIVRPMLDISREEIETHLANNNLRFVTDSTNLINDFKRNKLRNIILPIIRKHFPDADTTISNSIANFRENAIIYNQAIKNDASRYQNDNTINIAEIIADYPAPATLLFEILHPLGFSQTQINDIVSSATKSGRKFLAQGHTAILNRGKLEVTEIAKKNDEEFPISLTPGTITHPIPLTFENISHDEFKPTETNALFLDATVLDGEPSFKLRRWHKGDRLAPFGMRGSKKLSDIFSDAKLSLTEKENIWILTRNDEILWVVGLRASRHFAVTAETSSIIKITATSTK